MQVFGNPFNVIQTKRSNLFVINLEIEKGNIYWCSKHKIHSLLTVMNVATTLLVSASLAKCFRSVLKSSSSGVPKLSTDLGFCALGPDLVVGVAASLLRIKFSFDPSVNWYADKNVPSKKNQVDQYEEIMTKQSIFTTLQSFAFKK